MSPPSPTSSQDSILEPTHAAVMTSTLTARRSSRITLKPDISPDELPPLPPIKCASLLTQIFTHRSVHARPTHVFEDAADDPSPDNEMLEHLGDAVLSLVVTDLLREVYPYLRVGPSTKIRALVVGNPTLASISVMYALHERLIPHPAQAVTLRASTHIQADLFEAYVGGLYLDAGLEVVKTWLYELVPPYILEAYRITRVQHGLSPDPRPPQTPPPPAAPSSAAPAPPSRSVPSVGHLSLFNQHLQQNNHTIEWEYTDSAGEGSKTTPIWVVRAMVNGRCLGRGRGSTKKAAKNEAAKQGLSALGL